MSVRHAAMRIDPAESRARPLRVHALLLSELRNATVHAFLSLSIRPTPDGHLADVGVFVRPVNRFSRFLRLAESEEIVITRHGRPGGNLIGFETEDDWFDYRLEHHPELLRRLAVARAQLQEGRGVRLEDLRS